MSSEPQSSAHDFTIALSVFHHEEYRSNVLKVLKEHGFGRVTFTYLTDAENGRLLVRDAAAFVAVIGYTYEAIPQFNNPDQRFLTEIELDEAELLNRPLLVFFDSQLGTPPGLESASELKAKIVAFRVLSRILQKVASLSFFKAHMTFWKRPPKRSLGSATISSLKPVHMNSQAKGIHRKVHQTDLK